MAVTLVAMNQLEYDAWYDAAVADYAGERVRAGNTPADQALEVASRAFAQLLPQGLQTPSHHLYTVRDENGAAVGVIWLAHDVPGSGLAPTTGFIYDVVIYPEYRRRGYGREAMLALEDEARRLGLTALALHVFGHNTTARHLYETLGYQATNINMRKDLA